MPMSVDDQNVQTITLATNHDFLKMLNPQEFKIHGSSETHLPILAELVQYFGRQKVVEWMGDDSKSNYEKLMHEASNYVLPTTCGGGKLHIKAAVDYLERTYQKVSDVRPDGDIFSKMPKLDTVDPAKEDGWTFVSNKVNFTKTLQGYLPRKHQYIERSRDVQIHSTVIITGKMGVGKTQRLLRYANKKLKKGIIRSVLYLGPRPLLVEQAILQFRSISGNKETSSSSQRVYTTLYQKGVEGGSLTFNEKGELVKDGTESERR